MNNVINDGEKLLGDLSGYSRVAAIAKQLKQDIINWRKDKFKEWCQETTRAIDDPSQALRFEFYSSILCEFFLLILVWKQVVV